MKNVDLRRWEISSWIFTFGCGQTHEGRYIRIYACDYDEARAEMIRRYGTEWAFQYSEQEWNEWLQHKPEWVPLETELETIYIGK